MAMKFEGLDVRPNNGTQNQQDKPMTPDTGKNAIKKPVLSKPAKSNALLTKVKQTFFQGRNLEDVVSSVLKDVVVPTIIDGVANASKAAIDGMLYGDRRPPASSYNRRDYSSLTRNSRVSGGGINESRTNVPTRNYSRVFQNVEFNLISDAQAVMEYMLDYVATYDLIQVGEFYDACGDYAIDQGIVSTFADYNIGWTRDDLQGISVRRITNRWIIDLPSPRSLKT